MVPGGVIRASTTVMNAGGCKGMDYTEAKTKMEFGLNLLGYGNLGYRFVTEEEWNSTSEACKVEPHRNDLPSVVCGSCKIIYIMDSRLPEVTDEELVGGLHTMIGFIRNGTLR